ncbi:MAG: histidine kinase [Solidesulfovibrio magneticus str. Maddingley MBC34]|uniref:histidine kinase n=1 Tax=Solidesulfovibrio magneticus str. Maddingley MBC34 TaxID=1206767 RepID=K6H884_9BACT|nr:MAG: histidine kinase [Solidesulfovibrio magneticus str. Maddingley MBC34]
MPAGLTARTPRSARRVLVPAATRALLAALLLFCLAISGAAAQTPQPPAIAALAVLDGPEADVDLAGALALEREGRFRPLSQGRYAAPGDTVFWLRLSLTAPQGIAAHAYAVDLNWPYFRLQQWFLAEYPEANRLLPGEWNLYLPDTYALPTLPPGTATLYVRLAGYGAVNVNPAVLTAAQAKRLLDARPWTLGLFFGLMGAMLIYNLFLYLSLRDPSYALYVTNTALLIVYYACSSGLVAELIPSPTGEDHALFLNCFEISSSLLFANMGLFTRSFLLTRTESPRLDRLLRVQIGLALAATVAFTATGPEASEFIGPPMGILTSTILSIAAVTRLVQGFRPAVPFAIGWGFFVSCGALHSLTWLGVVAATPASIHAILAATAAEALVMSLALAYRVKLLREQAASAEAERRRLAEENARSESARDDLARENALLSMILDDRRFGIGMVRGERFCFANRRLARLLGREDLNGLTLADVPQAQPLMDGIAQAASDHEAEIEAVVDDDGRDRTLRTVGRTLDPARPERGTVFLVEDVSEAKRLEQLKNDINQVMRHDLKSPLATVAGVLEALELAGPLNVRQRELTAMLERAVVAMTARINLSLHLYRLESGDLGLAPQPLPLAALLAEAREELAPYLKDGRELRLAYEAPAEAFVVLGERAMVTALLVNLLKNALEAAGEVGSVVVTVADPPSPRLVIENPGEVPPAIRARLFEKHVTAGKARGTGLGAYSARLIARAFGGDVVADTTVPGRTVVTVTLRAPRDA